MIAFALSHDCISFRTLDFEECFTFLAIRPLISTNVSQFWPSDLWFWRMFHTFGHPTLEMPKFESETRIPNFEIRNSNFKFQISNLKFESQFKFQIWNSNSNLEFKFKFQISNLKFEFWSARAKYKIWLFGPRALSTKSGFLIRAR